MNLDIVVTNALGQKLLVRSLNTTNGAHTETIDLSTQAVGVYYLNISSEGNTLTNRMIIKK
ncbi:T9SS type A sorting domain-containing protein [Crocinitomicaceae bacterium]|nr:T9SS type A sorting domain-containing protein [Crocinitomicaceae bacterium]